MQDGAGNITVGGITGINNFDVTPTGADTANITNDDSGTLLQTTNTGTLTIDGGAAPNTNSVTVEDTAAADAITITNAATTTVSVVTPGPTALMTISVVTADTANLVVNGNAGPDLFLVTGTAGPNLTVNGDPNHTGALTFMNTTAGAGTTDFEVGNTWNSGAVTTPDDVTTAFTGMAFVMVAGNGTAANNTFSAVTSGLITLDAYNGTTDELNSNAQPILYFTNYATVDLSDTGVGNGDQFNITPVGLDGAGVTEVDVTGNATAGVVVNDTGAAAVTVSTGATTGVQVGGRPRWSRSRPPLR